jgi:hypothetical protein
MRFWLFFTLLWPLILSAQDFFKYGESEKYSSSIFNEKVQAIRSENKIVLHGSSCDVLNKEALSLQAWSKKKKNAAVCKCVAGKCTLNVTSILPALVAEKQSYSPPYHGPNCFNGALVVSGLMSNLRYTSGDEMHFWMTSPLCKERKAGEARQPGDVIVISSKEKRETHGFVHISENLSFSKNGSVDFPYSLQSPQNVYEAYRVPKECQNPVAGQDCSAWSTAYSCISMDEYLVQHPMKNQSQIETWKSLEGLDCTITSLAAASNVNAEVLELTKATLVTVKALAKKESQKAMDADEKLIWKGIYFKADAAIDQYHLIKLYN